MMRFPRLRLLLAFSLATFTTACGIWAQNEAAPAAPVKEIAPGVFELSTATLRQQERSISFPATVNMNEGLLEYLIVSPEGPTHESLLVSELAPRDLHLAMLLLGAKGSPKAEGGTPPPEGQITAEYLKTAPPLHGDAITVTVAWKNAEGQERSVPVEDWLRFGDDGKAAPRGPWTYTGSLFGRTTGKFRAQSEGLHAALVTNPAALINNPRPGHDDDKAWSANPATAPAPGTPVRVTIQLLAEPAP